VKRISSFLILVALTVGMLGCGGGPYTLTVTSTSGGLVTAPGEGTFTYNATTVVNLVAEAEEGYLFDEWTGNVSTIANVTAATTTITMHGNYTITANFYKPEIRTWYDLDAIRDNPGGSYLLMNDLNSTIPGYEELASPTANGGKGWQPICGIVSFTGTFDGHGYKIKDLFSNRPDEDGVGLFCSVGESGIVKNISVVNANMTGAYYTVVLVGFNYRGTVSNCHSTGTVSGKDIVSGLVGINAGTVSNSYSTATVTGSYFVGALVAANGGAALGVDEGTVTNCYSGGNVSGNECVGGLVGVSAGPVSNSYSTSSVTGNNFTGGLVGCNNGPVSNSYSTSSVTGDENVGGLVGINYDTVSNSFWDTETSGQATSDGGTGKNTTEMHDIDTFSGATWNITTVSGLGERNSSYIWNIVDSVTYPFLSWQPLST